MSVLLKTIANIISTNLIAQASKLDKPLQDLISKENLIELAKLFEENKLSNQGLSKAIEILSTSPEKTLDDILTQNNLLQINDTEALKSIVDKVISENGEQVQQYQTGKTQVIGYLVGQCMKLSKVKGNPKLFNELLTKSLTV